MGVFENVKATIDVNINANGEQRITGKVLNGVLQEIVSASESSSSDLQESLSSLSEKVDNIGSKDFNPSGTYPDLTAGDLAGRGESVPASFGFRASGGKSIKDGRAYIKRIKGNSVVWNNMVDTRGYEGSFVIDTGIKIIAGHKYLLHREYTNEALYLIPMVDGAENYDIVIRDGVHSAILQAKYTDTDTARVFSSSYSGACIISDLTKMFQAGNEPTTIEEFNARVATLGVDLYAYNEGKVIHCNTESIKSVGDNAWDEEWEEGIYSVSDGLKVNNSGAIRTKHPIPILPNTEYYKSCGSTPSFYWHVYYDEDMKYIGYQGVSYNHVFVTPANAAYMTSYTEEGYGTTYKHDILISLYHSGWKAQKDDQYQPYWQDILPLPIINNYFRDGMKKAGSAHDEIRFNKASGKWEYSKGKIKSVGLSSIIQEETGKDGEFLLTLPTNYAAISSYADIPRLLCSPFITNTVANVNGNNLNDCIYGVDDWLIIRSSRYFTLSDIKAAMAGVILYYESNDWEWEELDEADQNFRDYYNVADFGTEMSHSNVPSAAFSADIIYQFNAVDMIREHEAEINELQSIIATMQAQLTSLTSPTNL